jgi:threonyl-tRNA synthetase
LCYCPLYGKKNAFGAFFGRVIKNVLIPCYLVVFYSFWIILRNCKISSEILIFFYDFDIYIATKPEKYVGYPADWDKATLSLKKALELMNLKYEIDEGGGAFYGPKIDIKIKDALNRSWQCSTIQFDFNMSTRFDLEYIGSDNNPHRPFMIHRALMGSIERFFGTLIEFYGGNFPTWLCPIQAKVLTISDSFIEYASEVFSSLKNNGIRAEIDARSEKIGYKIREAELAKIPFILIIGEKEMTANTVALRMHTKGDLGSFTIDEVINKIIVSGQGLMGLTDVAGHRF